MAQFEYLLLELSFAVIFVALLRRAHLPPVLGYLAVGFLLGPGGLAWVPSMDNFEFLAEFGVVFLMFTLGLEFSIPRLLASKGQLFGVGGFQVIACTLAGGAGAYLMGLSLIQAFIIGAAFSLSSTAVVVKQLADQKEQHLTHGKLAINILLFQDIAAVFMLILIDALSGQSSDGLGITMLFTLLKGIGVFVGMALVGLWLLRPLFHIVAKAHSTELFMLATLLVALSAAAVTHHFDLSMALGAFLAGLLLGETEFRHQIEIDIRPFRDVLLGLFFIIIGTYLELRALPDNWQLVLITFMGIIVVKFIVISGLIAMMTRYSRTVSLRTGLVLAHGGEFGFVVLMLAINNKLIPVSERPAIFAAVVLSMIVAPFLIRFNQKIASSIFKKKEKDEISDFTTHELAHQAAEMRNHVIICGFGRVGQVLARFLEQENIPWLALDLDPMRISKSSVAGEHSFYGDATHPETLAAAGLARSRMVVITFEESAALEVLHHVRSMRLDVPVFVRTRDDSNLAKFQEAGATEVVPESLEGSLMLASHLLLTLGVPTSKIFNKIRRVHTNRYAILQGFYMGHEEARTLEGEDAARRSLHSIVVNEDAEAIGLALDEIIEYDAEDGPKINSLTRQNERILNPENTMVIQAGDVIVVLATPEEKYRLEEKILYGN